jgi:hypothetical protein
MIRLLRIAIMATTEIIMESDDVWGLTNKIPI